MKKSIAILLCFLLIFSSGCTRVTELDEKSFVTAIGFDKGENYNLRFTFVFTNPSKSSNSSNPKDKDETIVIEAPSLYSAIEQINNFKSKTIELTHTQTVIFSEELAKEGLGEYVYMLVRSSHFRPNTYVCIAEGSSMEYLENVNPAGVYHLEKFFQLFFDKITSGTKGDMYLYDSYFRLKSESGAGVLPYCAINKTVPKTNKTDNKGEEAPSEETSDIQTVEGKYAENTDDFAINTIAGNSISISDNTSQIQGVAVLKDGYMIGKLGKLDTICLQMITNSMPKGYFTLSNPDDPQKMITCYVTQNEPVKINAECKDKPTVDIEINLEGDFSEVGYNDEYIKYPQKFEVYFETKMKEAIESFLYKITKDFNCDICAFSDSAKSNFLTIDEWENYNWREKFKDCEYNVNVNLTMRTYGELSQRGDRKYD